MVLTRAMRARKAEAPLLAAVHTGKEFSVELVCPEE